MVYSFYQLLWLYMIYSFIGWCGEVAVAAVKRHRFVNRGAVSGSFLSDLWSGSCCGGCILSGA